MPYSITHRDKRVLALNHYRSHILAPAFRDTDTAVDSTVCYVELKYCTPKLNGCDFYGEISQEKNLTVPWYIIVSKIWKKLNVLFKMGWKHSQKPCVPYIIPPGGGKKDAIRI